MDAQKTEVVTRKKGPPSPKQTVLIVVVASFLWVPMIIVCDLRFGEILTQTDWPDCLGQSGGWS